MARAFAWDFRVYLDSISVTSGFEPLVQAEIPFGVTVERVVMSTWAHLEDVQGSSDMSLTWNWKWAQAIEVTTGTAGQPPPFPEPLSFDSNMNLRDFLWTGAYFPGSYTGVLNLARIPGAEPITVDTGTRRTPIEGETLGLWFVWDVNTSAPQGNQSWRGWANTLISVEVEPIGGMDAAPVLASMKRRPLPTREARTDDD